MIVARPGPCDLVPATRALTPEVRSVRPKRGLRGYFTATRYHNPAMFNALPATQANRPHRPNRSCRMRSDLEYIHRAKMPVTSAQHSVRNMTHSAALSSQTLLI